MTEQYQTLFNEYRDSVRDCGHYWTSPLHRKFKFLSVELVECLDSKADAIDCFGGWLLGQVEKGREREAELCKELLRVVANCEICGGTGHQEGSEYPGSEPCDSCATAFELLAKYEKTGESK